jgi:hypothetical protein
MTTIVVPFVGSSMVFIMIGFQTVSSPASGLSQSNHY